MSANLKMTFVDAVLSGHAEMGEIDAFVERWHRSRAERRSLASALGFTAAEYRRWVADPSVLSAIIAAHVPPVVRSMVTTADLVHA